MCAVCHNAMNNIYTHGKRAKKSEMWRARERAKEKWPSRYVR